MSKKPDWHDPLRVALHRQLGERYGSHRLESLDFVQYEKPNPNKLKDILIGYDNTIAMTRIDWNHEGLSGVFTQSDTYFNESIFENGLNEVADYVADRLEDSASGVTYA